MNLGYFDQKLQASLRKISSTHINKNIRKIITKLQEKVSADSLPFSTIKLLEILDILIDEVIKLRKNLNKPHQDNEECKIKLNADGRRALECIKTNRAPWNSIGLLAPIHDAVKWLNIHSSDQHEMTSTDHYRQIAQKHN